MKHPNPRVEQINNLRCRLRLIWRQPRNITNWKKLRKLEKQIPYIIYGGWINET